MSAIAALRGPAIKGRLRMSGLFEPEPLVNQSTRNYLIFAACVFGGLLSACVCWFLALAVLRLGQAQGLPWWSREQRAEQSDEEWNRRAAEFHTAELARIAT